MSAFRFRAVLTENGWLEDAVITVDEDSRILSVDTDPVVDAERYDGYALPGFQNAHSHAFQYAMAGLAERHDGGGAADDFWSWRTAMYELALAVSPDHLEAIAAMLYAEMVRYGYTAVAEFHYLHHNPDGRPYANLAEMGERLVAAAYTAGIKITLIPMFYQTGGFGIPPTDRQRRFLSRSLDDYERLVDSTNSIVGRYDHAGSGIGVHSLRAADGDAIRALCSGLGAGISFHIHAAEQLKEVADCLEFHGKRPVEWLLENVGLDDRFHLVHATHLSDEEVLGIAASGAHVVLCPTTEGNLGDGLFRFGVFRDAGGNWSIGTDSHVSLNPLEELRLLDYGQRLITHQRNTFIRPGQPDSGFNALTMAWSGGRKAMGRPGGSFFTAGQPLDAVIFDAGSPLLAATAPEHRCNTILYSCNESDMLGTMVSGNWIVRNGRHMRYAEIAGRFDAVMRDLGSRL